MFYIGIGLVLIAAAAFLVGTLVDKRLALIDQKLSALRYDVEEFSRLRESLERVKRDLKNPSTELTDFLADMKIHGCGMVRVDPDYVIVRSPRKAEG